MIDSDELVLHDGLIITVGEVRAAPEKYDGARCADPAEPGYRSDMRIAQINPFGRIGPHIYSHAHGEQIYMLPREPAELFPDLKPAPSMSAEAQAALSAATGGLPAPAVDPLSPEAVLAYMNGRYALIEDCGGRSVALDETADSEGKPIQRYRRLQDVKETEANRKVVTGSGDKLKIEPAWEFWRKHPKRRTYRGIIFDPRAGKLVNGYWNTWQGFAVEPKPGDWSLTQAFIRDVIAAGNEEHAAYTVKWTAWALQNPEKVAEVALVLRSGEGTGKGFLGRLLNKIFGPHGLHVTKPELLTGRFNGHLETTCFVFADEAFWAGDKAARGALYTLMTEPELVIEYKGMTPFRAPNRVKLIRAGNADWQVPAGPDARRWAVFDVSEAHKQDKAYFKALQHEIDDGGAEAMLHDLLARDLEGWHPREDVPQTEALMQQKMSSLDNSDAWFLDLIETGELPGRGGAGDMAAAGELLSSLREFAPYARTTPQSIAKMLRRWNCKPDRTSGARLWKFPPLWELRGKWCERYGARTWDKPNANWAGAAVVQACQARSVVSFAKR